MYTFKKSYFKKCIILTHKCLSAGSADDVLGSLVDFGLTLGSLGSILIRVSFSLLLRFSTL